MQNAKLKMMIKNVPTLLIKMLSFLLKFKKVL